jgi:phosphatidylglycerophosphate synthase
MNLLIQGLPAPRLSRVALAFAASGGVVLLALAWGITAGTQFGAPYLFGAFIIYLPASLVIVACIERYHAHSRFGLANGITLVRLIVCSLLAGFAAEASTSLMTVPPEVAWLYFAISVGSLILDGFDGLAARHQRLSSPFGARFDMEVDALQILVLSVAAFALAKAGWWILIGGVLRYLFMLASSAWPVLAVELPPSWRRKTIAVIQGGVVAALVSPIIVPPLSVVAAGVALALLLYSFTVDIAWLLRARGNPR